MSKIEISLALLEHELKIKFHPNPSGGRIHQDFNGNGMVYVLFEERDGRVPYIAIPLTGDFATFKKRLVKLLDGRTCVNTGG